MKMLNILHKSSSTDKQDDERTQSYLEGSAGLLLNTTSIITGTSKSNDEDLRTAKRLKTSPKKTLNFSSKIENQTALEYCPDVWYNSDEKNQSCKTFCWQSCFLCICLPICYPCYLTRAIRRNKNAPKDLLIFLDPNKNLYNNNNLHSSAPTRLTVSVIKSPQSETFLKEFEKQNTKQKSLAGIVEKALSRQETLKEAVKEKKPKKTFRTLGKAFINMKIFSSTTAQTSSNSDTESLKNNEVQQQDQPEPASDQSTLTKFFSARSSQSWARSQSLYHSLR